MGVISFLVMLAIGLMAPVMPLYLKQSGASPETVGFIFTTFFIALAIGEISWGSLSDRKGVRTPLILGMALAGLSTAGFIWASTIPQLYLLNFCRALGISALFPLARGQIGAAVPVRYKATFIGAYITLQMIGRTFGSLIGGLVGARSLSLVFYPASLLFVIASLVAFWGFKRNFKQRNIAADEVKINNGPSPRVSRIKLVRNAIVLGMTIAFFHLSWATINAFLPLHAVSADISVAQVGLLFTAWGVVTFVFTLPLGRLADRLGWSKTMNIGLVILVITMSVMSYANNFPFFLLAMVMGGLARCFFRPAATARFSEIMARNRQATAMGLLGVFEDIGNMTGPAAGGVLWEFWGPTATFLLGAAGGLLAILLNLIPADSRTATG